MASSDLKFEAPFTLTMQQDTLCHVRYKHITHTGTHSLTYTTHMTLYISHMLHTYTTHNIVYMQHVWNTHTPYLHTPVFHKFLCKQHETHLHTIPTLPSLFPNSMFLPSHRARLLLATLMLYLMWRATPCLSALVPRTRPPTGSRPCSTSRIPFQSTLVCTCLSPISCSHVVEEKREPCIHCLTTHVQEPGNEAKQVCTKSCCYSNW